MTIFHGARDLLDITGAVTPPRRRHMLRRFWARRRSAIIEYVLCALFLAAILAMAGLLDGPPR